MRRPLFVTCLLTVLLGAYIAPALAKPGRPTKQVEYANVHPLPKQGGRGFCNIEGPHVHIYRPDHADVLYRVVGGAYVFIGDPVPFGYDGPRHAFHGPHPIPVAEIVVEPPPDLGVVFCYLDGPHYHPYVPPPALAFTERGGAHWYTGEWPRSYQADAPRYRKINVVYDPLLYARPVITASAPVGYHVPVIAVTLPPRVKPPIVEVRVPWLIVDNGHDHHHCRRHHHHGHRKHRHHGHCKHRHHHHDHDDDHDD